MTFINVLSSSLRVKLKLQTLIFFTEAMYHIIWKKSALLNAWVFYWHHFCFNIFLSLKLLALYVCVLALPICWIKIHSHFSEEDEIQQFFLIALLIYWYKDRWKTRSEELPCVRSLKSNWAYQWICPIWFSLVRSLKWPILHLNCNVWAFSAYGFYSQAVEISKTKRHAKTFEDFWHVYRNIWLWSIYLCDNYLLYMPENFSHVIS